MAQRLEIRVSKTTSASIKGNYLNNMYDIYMSGHGRRMSPMWGGSGIVYKFDGIHSENRILVKSKKSVKNKGFVKPDVDMSRLVILGGTFEKIGGTDEAVGGGSQKVGSSNK